MKDIGNWWQAEDWLAVLARHADKRIFCLEHVAFYDGETIKHVEQRYEGYFVDESRGRTQDDESFEQVVVLHGVKPWPSNSSAARWRRRARNWVTGDNLASGISAANEKKLIELLPR